MTHNVSRLGVSCELRNRVFSVAIKVLAKDEREFSTKFAIAPNRCYM